MKSTIVCRIAPVAWLAAFLLAVAPLGAAEKAKYQDFKWEPKNYVPFDATTTVTVACPDPSALRWLEAHFAEWFGAHAPKVVAGDAGETGASLPKGDEAYAASVDESGVKIAANTLAGTRWASYTLRQLAIAKRGTFKVEGRILPKLTITDRPHLAFRAVHLCCFPETRIQQIERAIRLAALLKFNYAIIEPWGMYRSEKHPWWCWPNAYLTKKEVIRLVAIGKDLGITLIPQINCYGHASASRGCTIKHSVLDLNPDYEPLFEPAPPKAIRGSTNWDGWSWCLANPEAQRVLRELIAEIHENFDNPPFFHIGCDEAFGAQTCLECAKHPKGELLLKHISGLADFLRSRGARAMMWHDMLLDSADPRWNLKGLGFYVKFGNKETAAILSKLPKDIIICDWQYDYSQKKNYKPSTWPSLTHFAENGLSVAGCPWMNYKSMKPMADQIVKIGGLGIIETTWHRLRGKQWEKMYISAAYAAWGSPVSHDVSFQRSLRLVGHDMKVTDYLDTGYNTHQVPPGWWQN